MSKKINISIIGATGYTALELVRVLQLHPFVKIKYLISSNHNNEKISNIYPHLKNICDLQMSNIDVCKIAKDSDLIFLALPHFEAQKIIPKIIGKTKMIDLSGDFRINDLKLYEKYYGQQHFCPKYLKNFIYGMPELNKTKIQNAQNIANPGCFATAISLSVLPIKDLIKNLETFAITGSSGSGKNCKQETHHPTRSHNIKSYKIGFHQHIAEISEYLNLQENQIVFVPTSGPFVRGIHATSFITLNKKLNEKQISKLYLNFYKNSPFIRLQKNIQLVDVVASNFCDISLHFVNDKLIVQSVIDNLVKGASGTAVQNMNLMFGFDEMTGLKNLFPIYL